MAEELAAGYNDPAGGDESAVGKQLRQDYYYKKALKEMTKEQYFTPLADSRAMPKHFGKTIKQYHWMPMLDDANVNDQGISPTGDTDGTLTVTIKMLPPKADGSANTIEYWGTAKYATGEHASSSVTATTAAEAQAKVMLEAEGFAGADYATIKAAAEAANWTIIDGVAGISAYGNLYGSSKDIGTIQGKLPVLGEHGGRVNRVGFTRVDLEATLQKMGFFYEFTQESLDFDTEAELDMHLAREAINGAGEISEDMLQIDLLNGAGVYRFGGVAAQISEVTGVGAAGANSEIDYNDLMMMAIDLDNNRTPKHTKILTGSRMVDTRTIAGARILYIGSEMLPTFKTMVDPFGNQAFVPVHQYGGQTEPMRGEEGTVDQFRIVVVPEMMQRTAAGAEDATGATPYRSSAGGANALNFDVFPLLCVGNESFTTVGFQTDGKVVKFKITTKKPGVATATHADPYGEIGFSSIKWYYATMILRPERIALAYSVARV